MDLFLWLFHPFPVFPAQIVLLFGFTAAAAVSLSNLVFYDLFVFCIWTRQQGKHSFYPHMEETASLAPASASSSSSLLICLFEKYIVCFPGDTMEREREYFKSPVLLYKSSNILGLVFTMGGGSDGGGSGEKKSPPRKKRKRIKESFRRKFA